MAFTVPAGSVVVIVAEQRGYFGFGRAPMQLPQPYCRCSICQDHFVVTIVAVVHSVKRPMLK